jgi:DNA repair exonuclease SbcCD ATPase subunit
MSASDTLRRRLELLTKRLNLLRLETALSRTLLVGVTLSAVLLLLHKLYVVNVPMWLPLTLLVVTGGAGLMWWRARRATLFEAAMDADAKLQLRERLSSAIAFVEPEQIVYRPTLHLPPRPKTLGGMFQWFAQAVRAWREARQRAQRAREGLLARLKQSSEARSALVPALVTDAAERCEKLNPRELYPLRFDRPTKLLCLSTVAMVAFFLMPAVDRFRPGAERAARKTVKAEGERLKVVAKQMQKESEDKKLATSLKAAKELAKLAEKLQNQRMEKKDALLDIGKLAEQVKQMEQETEQALSPAAMEQLKEELKKEEQQMNTQEMQDLSKQLQQQNMQQAAEQLQKLAQKMQQGNLSEQEKKKLAEDMQKLAKAMQQAGLQKLAQQAQQLSQQMQQQQQQGQQGANPQLNAQLNAKQMQQLAQQLGNMNLTKEQLEALKQMAENLKQAEQNIGQSDTPCKTCEGRGKLGKDGKP